MKYEGNIYRPPSEAFSLILQVTIGCSHNKCTFCSMYKDKNFRVRKIEETLAEIESARSYYPKIEKIFLADGNALALNTNDLELILRKIKEVFPECKRVGVYSAPKDILRKSEEELKGLHDLGLSIAYMGVESGSDEILLDIHKGVTAEEMLQAGKKIMASGIKLSVTLISGLGGKEKSRQHALASAKVINGINPDYLALLTLLIQPETRIYEDVQMGKFKLLTPREVMEETELLIKNLTVDNCVFRSNHASNYVPLAGILPEDQENILRTIRQALKEDGEDLYKGEGFRRL